MAKMTTLFLAVPPLVVTALPLLLASPSFPAPSWLASVGSCLYTRPTRAPQTSPAPGGSVADPALNSPALPGAPRSACKAPTRHRLLPPLGRRRPHRPRTARQSAAARVSRHACAPGAPSPPRVSQVNEPLYRSWPILNVVPSRSPRDVITSTVPVGWDTENPRFPTAGSPPPPRGRPRLAPSNGRPTGRRKREEHVIAGEIGAPASRPLFVTRAASQRTYRARRGRCEYSASSLQETADSAQYKQKWPL